MFRITGNVIEITRGDKATIDFEIDEYEFGLGDVVRFRVYEKKGMDKIYHLKKAIKVMNTCDKVEISLSSDDTKIGEMANKEITYWYEIELNGNQTILGYDNEGAKEFIVYPEGFDEDEDEVVEEYYGNNDSTGDSSSDSDSSSDEPSTTPEESGGE